MEQKKILRGDYRAPSFEILKTKLHFNISTSEVVVTSELTIQLSHSIEPSTFVELDGYLLNPTLIEIDGLPIEAQQFEITDHSLKIYPKSPHFTLKTRVHLNPKLNTQLEGLYQSKGFLLTQCEPEGFRRITYYADRPDILSQFEVEIEADQNTFPDLLSNGNLIKSEVIGNIKKVKWVDPFLKPCYLFALVAGKFEVLESNYVTQSGRNVSLKCYVTKGNIEKSRFALESLKKAMRWDEQRFGLEYDLDTYMIVATDDFNAGAMENKGLNIFNSKLVLADPESATDDNYFAIESVVAHEYFHNWSGNRVTLRDWFNLSLKEGLTVFRDQEFSMDTHSRALVRIETVQALRSRQFAEDSGPNAHPVYPNFCYAVDNFFTATIYEKGAEVIRMIQTLVGRPAFDIGLRHYFNIFDGKAVTIEDFSNAIFESSYSADKTCPFDPDQFKLWYSQSGTPRVSIIVQYNNESAAYKISFSQTTPGSEDQPAKLPLIIPLVTSVYQESGASVTLEHSAFYKNSEDQYLFIMSNEVEQIEILHSDPHLLFSFNQGFSSPIIVNYELDTKSKLKLFAVEADSFNKWDIAQSIYTEAFLSALKDFNASSLNQNLIPVDFLRSLSVIIKDPQFDPHLLALLLELPSNSFLVQRLGHFDPDSFHLVRHHILKQLARELTEPILNRYQQLKASQIDPAFSTQTMALRKLQNQLLYLLQELPQGPRLSFEQFQTATCMSEKASAFQNCLNSSDYRDQVASDFFNQWKHDSLTLNKWFSALASSEHPKTNDLVKELWLHPHFNIQNPNRVYSLLRSWGQNLTQFHSDSANYDWFLQKCLDLDKLNPQVVTRVAQVLDFGIYLPQKIRTELKSKVSSAVSQKLSPNLFEVLSKIEKAL